MPAPKNDELDMLRREQRGGFSMADTAREIARSANTSADIILDVLRPKEPEIVGIDAQGRPLYKSIVPFAKPVTADMRDIEQALIAGGFGGAGAGAASGMRYGRKPLAGQPSLPMSGPKAGPLAKAGPRDIASFSPKGGQLASPSGPSGGPITQTGGGAGGMLPPGAASGGGRSYPGLPAPPTVEVLPSGANPFARPGRVVDPAMRPGLPSPAPNASGYSSGYGKDPFGSIPSSFGDQFANINYGPNLGRAAKIAGAAGLATGAAALAGGLAGDGGKAPQGPQSPEFMDYMNAAADIPGALAGTPLADAIGDVPAVDPTVPEPIRVSGRNKRRGMPVSQQDLARKAQQQMQQGVSPSPMPQTQRAGQAGQRAPSYWVDLMQAADSGDAYARDFVLLREQAREAAQQAAMQGSRDQYVPLMDYRNNTVHIVNAGGNDVVLDLSDPQDRAQYAKIAAQQGDPTMFQRWMQRASAPLMGYFRPPGSGTTAAQFSPNETVRLQSRVM